MVTKQTAPKGLVDGVLERYTSWATRQPWRVLGVALLQVSAKGDQA